MPYAPERSGISSTAIDGSLARCRRRYADLTMKNPVITSFVSAQAIGSDGAHASSEHGALYFGTAIILNA